ncbi:helix-turn-helix domain-containing protein [Allostella humosa]|nr:helix-turn-helix domain-containing protein [Stella humosa]
MTLDEIAKNPGTADERRLDAMTDEAIEQQIAGDPDVAPDVMTLGAPLPDLKRIRLALGLNQDAFAAALGLPLGTVRNWEQRRTIPDPAAMALLRIVEREPDAAFRALGAKPKAKKPGGRAKKAA